MVNVNVETTNGAKAFQSMAFYIRSNTQYRLTPSSIQTDLRTAHSELDFVSTHKKCLLLYATPFDPRMLVRTNFPRKAVAKRTYHHSVEGRWRVGSSKP